MLLLQEAKVALITCPIRHTNMKLQFPTQQVSVERHLY